MSVSSTGDGRLLVRSADQTVWKLLDTVDGRELATRQFKAAANDPIASLVDLATAWSS